MVGIYMLNSYQWIRTSFNLGWLLTHNCLGLLLFKHDIICNAITFAIFDNINKLEDYPKDILVHPTFLLENYKVHLIPTCYFGEKKEEH